MKKLYILTITLFFSCTLFGQLVNQKLSPFKTENNSDTKKLSKYPNDKSIDNDLEASEGFYGFGSKLIPYTRIPTDQISSAQFSIKTTNVGLIDQPNTILTATVNGWTAFTGTSTPITNLVGITDSLIVTTQWTPPTTPLNAPYNITLSVTSDSIDDTPANNTITFPTIEISQYCYCLDDNIIDGNGGGYNANVTPSTEDFEAGNFFEIINTTQIGRIDIVIGSGTIQGAIFDLVLYDVTSGSFIQVDRSAAHIVMSGEIGSSIGLSLNSSPTLYAGSTYFVAVHGWGATGAEFFYATSGTSPDTTAPSGATSLISYPNMINPNIGEAYYTTETPMIRLVSGWWGGCPSPVGTKEISLASDYKVYPNPSNTGIFNIVIESIANEVTDLLVKNTLGQTIINKKIRLTEHSNERIDLTDYSNGIYFLTIGRSTSKLIVN